MFRFSCLVLTADCIEPEVPPVTRKDSETHTPRWTKTRQRGQQKSYRSPTHAGTDQKVVACKTEKGSGWEERTCRGSEDWVGSSHSRRSKRAVNNHGKNHIFLSGFSTFLLAAVSEFSGSRFWNSWGPRDGQSRRSVPWWLHQSQPPQGEARWPAPLFVTAADDCLWSFHSKTPASSWAAASHLDSVPRERVLLEYAWLIKSL